MPTTPDKPPRLAFILGACADGPMIFSRLDYKEVHGGGGSIGVGAWLLECGYHEANEIDALLRLTRARAHQRGLGAIGANAVVVDCGANVGAHTLPWAKAMRGWGEILAIEPQERVFYALAGNIALNNLFNARAIWAAVSDQEGFMPSALIDYQAPAHFSGMSLLSQYNDDVGQEVKYGPPVRTLTIDGLGLSRLDVLKIDVEGMEPKVLRGAAATIERCKPIISAEHTTCGKQAIIDALPGYRVEDFGMNLLCMGLHDPLWQNITRKPAA